MNLLFDLDGTIVDTEKIAIKITDAYYQRHKLKVNPKDLEILVGHTWNKSVEYLASLYPLKKSGSEIERELLYDYRIELSKNVPIIPGSTDAINTLSKEFKMAVVSGSHRSDIELILNTLGIRNCFELIVGFEDYTQCKPAPEPYLIALKRLGARPETSLVFEDSYAGIQAAQAAGLRVVQVQSPHFNSQSPNTLCSIDNFLNVDTNWVNEREYSKISL